MSNLSPKDIAKWFRERALEFNRIADTVENTFLTSGSPAMPVSGNGTVTPAKIKEALKIKAMRRSELATMFHVSESEIDSLVTSENGLEKGQQGWIKEV